MSTTTDFNLIDDPWLPVRYADGRTAELGIRAALRDAPQIRHLTVAFALEYVATTRMLMTVLQAALRGPRGVTDKAEWLAAHDRLMPTVDSYLDAWSERFELFDPERPFMQAPVGEDVAPSAIAALRSDWASGNNVTLFDHHVDRRPEGLPPGGAARALFTTLLFQPGGGVSRPFNRTDSPATRGLQVLVEGDSLWESLVANAPVIAGEDDSLPYWERDAHDDDRVDRGGTLPDGWLDRATWRSRAVRLIPGDDGLVRAVRVHQHLKLGETPDFDPFAPVRATPGTPTVVLRASPHKAIWRDAEAVIRGLRPGDEHEHAPVVEQALRVFERVERPGVPAIRVVGQILNKAKVADVRDARLPLSRALLEDDAHLDVVAGLMQSAETGAKALRGAIHDAVAAVGVGDGWARAARWETVYWAMLAGEHFDAMRRLAALDDVRPIFDEVVLPWRQSVRTSARTAFGRFQDDGAKGRATAAMGQARAGLDRRLRLLNPKDEVQR